MCALLLHGYKHNIYTEKKNKLQNRKMFLLYGEEGTGAKEHYYIDKCVWVKGTRKRCKQDRETTCDY